MHSPQAILLFMWAYACVWNVVQDQRYILVFRSTLFYSVHNFEQSHTTVTPKVLHDILLSDPVHIVHVHSSTIACIHNVQTDNGLDGMWRFCLEFVREFKFLYICIN